MIRYPIVHIRFYQVPAKVERQETTLVGIAAASRRCAKTGIGIEIKVDRRPCKNCYMGWYTVWCEPCRDYHQTIAERRTVIHAVAKQWKCPYKRSPYFFADDRASIIIVARGTVTATVAAKAREVRDAVMKKFLRLGYTAYVEDDRGGVVEQLPSTKWARRAADVDELPRLPGVRQ